MRSISVGMVFVLATMGCSTSPPASTVPSSPSQKAAEAPRAAPEPEPVESPGDTAAPVEPATQLPIPARDQAPESPPSGWCGETAIQEILLYYGAWAPQAVINRAGKPKHPDLYASDIPVALRNVGLSFARYRNEKMQSLDSFLQWLDGHLEQRRPVLLGVKIYPTEHPSWGLDHFVLVVGRQGDGLVVNTTWGDSRVLTRQQLESTTEGLSLVNRYGSFWALPVSGFADRTDGPTTRIVLADESASPFKAHVVCERLEQGREYVLVQSDSLRGKTNWTSTRFVATDAKMSFPTTLSHDRVARFSVKASGE